jgi:phosphatidylinositol alpha-mannosyltransferase
MKIGIVTEYYYPVLGGITEHVHHFALEAHRMGHEPVIITSNAGTDMTMADQPIEVVKIGRSLPVYSNGSIARVTIGFNLAKKIQKFLAEEKFDIIHTHSPLFPTLPLIFQRYTDAVTVGTFHTQFDAHAELGILQKYLQPYFDGLDGRIAVSNLCVESMDRYCKGNYRIIPNGVDTDKFNPSCERIHKFDDGKLNIFFLSRLEPRNGLEYLIQAFAKIHTKRKDCRLIIGGGGPLMGHYRSLVPTEAQPDVHFVGEILGSRPNFYATADIFCFPTTRASFGITLLEAMAAGKPVVAFTLPAFRQVIKETDEGVLCGAPDANNLADALMGLLDDANYRQAIGAKARTRAEEFSWHNVTQQVIAYYEELLSQTHQVRRHCD